MKHPPCRQLCILPLSAAFLTSLLFTACSDSNTRPTPTPQVNSPTASPTDNPAAVDPMAQPSPETAQRLDLTDLAPAEPDRTPLSVGQPNNPEGSRLSSPDSQTDTEPAVQAPGTSEPPDIFAILTDAGYVLVSDRDLADYLPVPPRATGQVGQFQRGDTTFSIARVTYPAELFADPHENWIRERMALIPDCHERVVRIGATVIHITAETDADADAIARLVSGRLDSASASPTEEQP
ncbi:MAG: hypothetical protein JW797_16990 [Bradymonadales bacterium]|nr:hypothetical protein [Bradymonadales bacterium]